MLYSACSGALETKLCPSDWLFLDLLGDLACLTKVLPQVILELVDRRRDARDARGEAVSLTGETVDTDRLRLRLTHILPDGDDGGNGVFSFSFPNMGVDKRSAECRGIEKFTQGGKEVMIVRDSQDILGGGEVGIKGRFKE